MISYKSITRKELGSDKAKATNAALVNNYYQNQKDDYYAKEKQPSEWYGNLSHDLGILGKNVDKEEFVNLLNGQYKGNTLRDSSYKKKESHDRLAIDITFNAPKSVSIMALVAGDTRLIAAHNEAVKESLDLLESMAQGRKKVGGKSRVENTKKIAAALFRHETNRNNDPHLHTHSVVLNITKRSDGEYRALHNDRLVRAIPTASQNYQSTLARKCKELGYDIRINENGLFDLAHISREQLMQFSSRGREVEENLAKMGLTRQTATKEQRQKANFATRQKKQDIDKPFVQNQWVLLAKKLGLNSILTTKVIKKEVKKYERDGKQSGNGGKNQHHIASPNAVGRETIAKTDGVHGVQGGNMAGAGEGREMFLQDNSQLELHKQRASTNQGLRWFGLSFGSFGEIKDKFRDGVGRQPKSLESTPNMEQIRTLENGVKYSDLETQTGHEHENVKDMMNYAPPTSEITEEWRDFVNELQINIEHGKAYNNAKLEMEADELIEHVVKHLLDKRVETSKDDIIKEMLIKGFGDINYKQAEAALDEFVEEGRLIKTQSLYKPASERDDNKSKSIDEWVKFLTEDKKMEEKQALTYLKQAITENRLVEVKQRYTTKEQIAREERIISVMRRGRGAMQPFYSQQQAEQALLDSTLNQGQKSAARLIMTSQDRVIGIQGYAGVGKSYALSETLKYIKDAGGNVHVFAPYGSQVKSLQKDGLDANTLAKLLSSKKMQGQINQSSLIVVDEAGLIDNYQAEKLLNLVHSKKCKLVLLGDTQQIKAIGAGKPFDLLQSQGMQYAVINEIQRQQDPILKKAVQEAAINRTQQSVQTLGKSVTQIEEREPRLDYLVGEYMKLPQESRDKTLIVSGTNEDKDYINNKIREAFELSGKGVVLQTLKNIDMSREERSHARYFKIGQLVQVNTEPQNTFLKKGLMYEVIGRDKHLLIVKDSKNNEIKFSPNQENLSAYESASIEVSQGDKIRVTKSMQDLNLSTGDGLEVVKISNAKIEAKDTKTGKTFKFNTKDALHIEHNYCSTVHSSQGLTVDNVLINFDTKSRTTSKEIYYVAVSRARFKAIVVTDDMKKLPEAITKGADKHSAIELANNKLESLRHNTNKRGKNYNISFEIN